VNLLPFPNRARIVDWRTLSAEKMAALYEIEADRWSRLDWDTTTQWQEVERGRQFGTISGVVALDETGKTVGWSFYQIRNRALQIGVLDAADESVTQLLVDRALSEQTLAFVETVTFFALTDAPGLTTALRAKLLSVDRYWYLGKELQLGAPPPPLSEIRRWRDDDAGATCELLARAYKGALDSRPFAPGGRPEEWIEYVNRLTKGFGCGAMLPEASLVIPSGPNRVVGLAIVTRIAENTAHLAQLVVDPQFQNRRLAAQLMDLASAAAARNGGCRRMTLIVGGSNRRARSIYETARFQAMGSFVAAGTLQPRRSTSVAPAGTLMTRR
jgi:ribosomal protein S18 acetylase RimI-like enzyme